MRYGYVKERNAPGWSVWGLADETGDRREWIALARDRRQAERIVARCYRKQKTRG